MAKARQEKTDFANAGTEKVPAGATGKAADRTGKPLTESRNMIRLTGFKAVEYAEKKGLTLNKHPDRIQGPRQGLSVAEGVSIASEDPSLIWLDVDENDYQDALTTFDPSR
jgi:hypothetical protein